LKLILEEISNTKLHVYVPIDFKINLNKDGIKYVQNKDRGPSS
jgi:hypothetical protein